MGAINTKIYSIDVYGEMYNDLCKILEFNPQFILFKEAWQIELKNGKILLTFICKYDKLSQFHPLRTLKTRPDYIRMYQIENKPEFICFEFDINYQKGHDFIVKYNTHVQQNPLL